MKTTGQTVAQLRTFCLVYKRGSFSAVAQLLGLATPSIWAKIKGLELHYGAQLFVREGRGIRATPAADSLYRALLPILASLDAIQLDAASEPTRLSLAIGEAVVLDVAGSLSSFLSTPQQAVRVTVKRVPDQKVDDLILSGEADIGMWQVTQREVIDRELSITRVGSVPCWLVFPSSHPLVDSPCVALADVARSPLIVGPPGSATRKSLAAAVQAAEQMPNLTVPVESNDFSIVIACVRAGIGVGVVAAPREAFCVPGLIARPLNAELGQVEWAIGHRRDRNGTSKVVAKLLAHLRQSATAALAKPAKDVETNSTTVNHRRIRFTQESRE